jgi:predicted secreted hydrolase
MWGYRIERILELNKKYFLYGFCLFFAAITYGFGFFLFGFAKRYTGFGQESLSALRKWVSNQVIEKPAHLVSPQPNGSDWERFHDPDHALTCWNDQQTQWWYFSGNLNSQDGRNFGYELVFFRRKTVFDFLGILPGHWFKRNLFVAHFALSHVQATQPRRRFRYWHRGGFFSNTKVFASSDSFHVDVGGWSAYQDTNGDIVLNAQFMWDSISLKLHPTKPLVYHSEGGYSRREADPSVSSYHCSFTRLETSGHIMSNGETLEVSGQSWLDHEKMLAGRERLSHGWDWYSIQFDNNEELMLYLFHNSDGTMDWDYSYGTFVDARNTATHLSSKQIEVQIKNTWTSPISGGTYPSVIEVRVPSLLLDVEVQVFIPHCELNCVSTTFVAYWEGPIHISGKRNGKEVSGRGFLELCGYDQRKSSKLVHFMLTPEPHTLNPST